MNLNLQPAPYIKPPPTTAQQLLTNAQILDANSLAYAFQDAINGTNDLAQAAIDFSNGLPDPNQKDFWGNNIMDSALDQIGNFTPTLEGAPTNTITGIPSPGTILVDAITLPTIAVAPVYTQNNLGFVWSEALWDLSLCTAVEAKLLYDLANGGYGIEPTDELALWQRVREREQLNGESVIQDASRQAAARGLMLPPGALYKQIQAAAQAALEKSSSVSRDVAMKRADLYVQNRQFTIEKALATQEVLLNYVSAYFTRQLEAMKANLEAYHISVEIYDAQVKAYLAQLSGQEAGIRMKVMRIDALVKTYTASLGMYEAQLRNEIQKAEVNIEVYKATLQRDAVWLDGTYKAQSLKIQGAEARLRQKQAEIQNTVELNKTKLGAMEQAAKLFIEPAQAIASIANAYIGSTSSIALASS